MDLHVSLKERSHVIECFKESEDSKRNATNLSWTSRSLVDITTTSHGSDTSDTRLDCGLTNRSMFAKEMLMVHS